ncbi:hypothetical protein HID58_084890 [Brassica napus]|uniref:Uncharacterized protein n=1 Tax=Brassica napus TaxID=3708 RepID=A0ABQ7XL21_BRANA|nr:hypothetical protein HID58_084869 [Brassica napus]KAH0856629.1 hypothetical protein HID58_084890 [Brassica napus]
MLKKKKLEKGNYCHIELDRFLISILILDYHSSLISIYFIVNGWLCSSLYVVNPDRFPSIGGRRSHHQGAVGGYSPPLRRNVTVLPDKGNLKDASWET